MRKFFEIGGLVAAAVLIAFGVVAIVMGVNGRSTVRDSLKLEQIVGTPDMTPSAIAAEAKKAGLPASIALPTIDVAGKPIDTGARARAFATYMRIHTLEATGGVPYAQMPRYATADGKGTNDADQGVAEPNGQPVDNGAPQPLGDRDRPDDGAQHELHGRAARALRYRRRSGAAALRHRLRDPRDRRGTPQPGDGAHLVRSQAGHDRSR